MQLQDPLSAWLRDRYPQRSFLDPDEVATNQRGEFTPAQRASLNRKLAEESLTGLAFALIGLGLGLFVSFFSIGSMPIGLPLSAYTFGILFSLGAGCWACPVSSLLLDCGRSFSAHDVKSPKVKLRRPKGRSRGPVTSMLRPSAGGD
jgi:hypothetical protein